MADATITISHQIEEKRFPWGVQRGCGGNGLNRFASGFGLFLGNTENVSHHGGNFLLGQFALPAGHGRAWDALLNGFVEITL